MIQSLYCTSNDQYALRVLEDTILVISYIGSNTSITIGGVSSFNTLFLLWKLFRTAAWGQASAPFMTKHQTTLKRLSYFRLTVESDFRSLWLIKKSRYLQEQISSKTPTNQDSLTQVFLPFAQPSRYLIRVFIGS